MFAFCAGICSYLLEFGLMRKEEHSRQRQGCIEEHIKEVHHEAMRKNKLFCCTEGQNVCKRVIGSIAVTR